MATATGLSARTYTITVTDDSLCTAQSNIVITQPNPPVDAGTISGSQDVCQGATPTTLTESSVATGGNGSYTYLWQESTDLSTWSNAFGTNNTQNYSPPPLSTTKYYRRQVTSVADVDYTNILVINYHATPSVGISPLATKYCVDDGTITVTGFPTNSSGSFSPTGAGLTDNGNGTASLNTGTIGSGLHTITYSYMDSYGCSSSANTSTTINLLPSVSYTGFTDGSTVQSSDPPISLTGSPSGGTFSGTGVAGSAFYPSIADVGGPYPITYSYTDPSTGCANSAVKNISVAGSSTQIITNLQDEYCIDASPSVISGPGSGYFQSHVGLTDHGNGSATWAPGVAGIGSHAITFVWQINLGFPIGTISIPVNGYTYINPLPTVEITGVNATYCDNEADDVIYGSPSGGTWSGDVSSSILSPSTLGAGIYNNITYTYTDPSTGCVNNDVESTEVFGVASPAISGTPSAPIANQYCEDAAIDILTGTPATTSSYFTGNGITNTGTGVATFDPGNVSYSTHPISYVYIDGNGCTETETVNLRVDALPNVFISGFSQSSYCEDHAAFNISGNQAPNGSFSGASVTDNFNGTATFDPSTVPSETTQTIVYSYTDANFCSNSASTSVYINSLPDVEMYFGTDPDTVFCTNEGGVSLIGSPVGVLGFNASFVGTGVSSSTFFPTIAGTGNHTITYNYTHPITGCSNSDTRTAIVYNPPTASITGLPTSPISNQYCIDAAKDTIQGFPVGNGYFTGNGITDLGNNTAQFDPNNASTGNHTVKYIYEDANNCVDTATQVVKVDPLPTVVLSGFSTTKYCKDQSIISIAGNQAFGSFTGAGVTDFGDGTADFDPGSVIPDSTYRITYSYVDGNFCTDTAEKNITIYDLPVVTLTIATYPDTSFCETDGSVTLIGSPVGSLGTTSIYSGPGTAGPAFSPSSTIIGLDTLVYQYRDGNGCVNRDTQEVYVYPNPVAEIDVLNHCNNDSIRFADSSTVSPAPSIINQWSWNFGDIFSGTNNTSTLQNPSHFYSSPGTYQIKLTTTTNYGCTNSTQLLDTIGEPPVAEISWDNVCLGQITQFSDSLSESNNDIILWEWDFGDGDTSGASDPQHLFNTLASYPVQLKITTKSGCSDSVTEILNVRPVVNSFPYFEDFESGNGNWYPENATGDTTNSWFLGTPAGGVISKAYSGSNAFTLNQLGTYYSNEVSYVEGPCFDLSDIDRPMIHLNYQSAFTDTDDGVVLQYQYTDKSTAVQIPWTNVGDIINNTGTGIKWYNSATIDANPGGKSRGWTGYSKQGTVNDWVEGRHHLDFLVQDTNIQNIRFRLAFASDNSSNSEGFAFDDIWIGNRTRLVLAEHFTNNSALCDSCLIADDAVDQLVSDYSSPRDVIDIQYHTNTPDSDPLFEANTADPNSRSLFYSISDVPKLVMDGNKYTGSSYQWASDSSYMRLRSLQDPLFNISLGFQLTGNTIDIQTRLEAADSILNEDLVLRIALVEKNVYTPIGGNGDTEYRNVLRKMLPTASGTDLKDFYVNWYPGDTLIDSVSHTLFNFDDAGEIGLIAFVQNSSTKEIYQAAYRDVEGTVTGLPTYISKEIGLDFLLFPNPTDNNVNLIFKENLKRSANLYLYNSVGQYQKELVLEAGIDSYHFEVGELPSGVYILKIVDEDKVAGIKRVVIQH